MKKSNGLFSKLQNMNFDFSSFAERVKDSMKRKNRALRVRLKKIPWIYKLYVRLRKAKYNFKHSKFYLSISGKWNALLDKLLTEKTRKMLWSIKRSTGYKFIVRFSVICIAVLCALGIMNSNNSAKESSAAAYSEVERKVVANAGNDEVIPTEAPVVEDQPVATEQPVVTEAPVEDDSYFPFVPTEDNSEWLKNARQNSYNENNYIDYKGYKFYSDENVKKSYIGIDVSTYQGDINWAQVRASGVSFAMIRIGLRGYVSGKIMYDEKFVQNIVGAQKAGIKVGVYFFSQAITEQEAIEEANFVINAIKKYNITMPVAFDGEHVPDRAARTNKANLTNAQRTDIAIAFLDTIKSAGYIPMLYDNNSHLTGGFQLSRLDEYYIWYARYAAKPGYKYGYEMWQFSESGKVNGIAANVDLNVCMVNFPYMYLNGQK